MNDSGRFWMRAALIVLTVFLAASIPARFLVAYLSPDLAEAAGSPDLRRLPSATVVVIAVTVTVHAFLMIVVIREVWTLSKVIQTGQFFTKENVVRIRRAGFYLITLSALSVLAIAVAILSLVLSGRSVDLSRIWVQIFNLPFGTLICGLLSVVISQAFDHALKLDKEARLTV